MPTTPLPRFVHDPSFEEPSASRLYDPADLPPAAHFDGKHMPDDVTRAYAKAMHFAAFRAHQARTGRDQSRWLDRYFHLRDGVVVGNRKLVYRAVRKQLTQSAWADDFIGDCNIVLIHAVAAYNPWLGIRFSTYAFTCLIRAISRLSQRRNSDWLGRALPLEMLPDGVPNTPVAEEPSSSGFPEIDVFLRDDHPLLTEREKAILNRRFRWNEQATIPTLEMVGRDMGLSKERVRQVQAIALGKLRVALQEPVAV